MLRLLQLLVFGHAHKWTDVSAWECSLKSQADGKPYKVVYVTKCAHCGAYRSWSCR